MRITLVIMATLYSLGTLAQEGYVSGENYCYKFSSPENWVIDTIKGKGGGTTMVFYPKGSSWSNAETMFFTLGVDFVRDANSASEKIKANVDAVVQDYERSDAGPNFKATKVKSIVSISGEKGELWKLSGNQWGNPELVAYFVGKNTLNLFVMNSKNEEALEDSSNTFSELYLSYQAVEDCLPCTKIESSITCSEP